MFFKYKDVFFISIVLVLTSFFSTISKAEESYLRINYGISSHDTGATTTGGTITYDDDDQGFILSGGYMVGDFWGVDFMYYDLGSTSISALDANDTFKIDSINHLVETAGTIKNDTTGFGIGKLSISI